MNENKYKICCLTGHRPKGFPWNYYDTKCINHQVYLKELRKHIIKLIDDGYNYFISGMAIGADIDFAEICEDLRDNCGYAILIEGAIPCPNQTARWSATDKNRYAEIYKKLDKITLVSDKCTQSCFQKRNEYMIDRAEHVIAIWNTEQKGGTWNSLRYAYRRKKEIWCIFPDLFARHPKNLKLSLKYFFEQLPASEKAAFWKRLTSDND